VKPRRDGDLEIVRETTLAELPRGRDEVLRLQAVEAHAADGKVIVWHSLRVWYRAGDELRPGKAGITIRSRELGAVAAALSKAASETVDAGSEQRCLSGTHAVARESRAPGPRAGEPAVLPLPELPPDPAEGVL
jgi:hypothetical protein